MALDLTTPGVYLRPRPLAEPLPGLRTDVVGFVGIGGARHLHERVQVDDYRAFVAEFLRDANGRAIDPPPGSRLADAVYWYFANGGARAYVVNVAESPEDLVSASATGADLLGEPRTGLSQRTGLELLLLEEEVSIVSVPDLHASLELSTTEPVPPWPPRGGDGVFHTCDTTGLPALPTTSTVSQRRPLFERDVIAYLARRIVERCGDVPWKVFVLLDAPYDPAAPQSATAAEAVRFAQDVGAYDHAALYHPWVEVQDQRGGPLRAVPASFHVAGLFARKDLEAGPHWAPANAELIGPIKTLIALSDSECEQAYDKGVNPLISRTGFPVAVWGSRTLAYDRGDTLAFPTFHVGRRRCLSAIERNLVRIGRLFAFEPNVTLVRAQLQHAAVVHLLEVHKRGGLFGTDPSEAFRVICDGSVNTDEGVDQGQLICEVHLALSYPSEFVIVRLGRREGIVEIDEVRP